jgi:UDP-N-acetylglucosamine 1-carboxyvinyltransferase
LDKLVVTGGAKLDGSIRASGSKNATLAVMAGTLLAKGETILWNVPKIGDIYTMAEMLRCLGARVEFVGDHGVLIDATVLTSTDAPHQLVKKMRASFSVLGPLLARCGRARVAEPGGCDIGARPIDFHLKGLHALGTLINREGGFVEAEADVLHGAEVYLDFPSAGATQHIMTAAALADGTTTIHNCAMEPEIVCLADILTAMGARVHGAGTTTISVEGVTELHGVEFDVIPDRMEVGTFALAGVITGGDIRVEGVVPIHLEPFVLKLRETGALVEFDGSTMRVRANSRPMATDIVTLPHPGFPTDMQQPFASLLSVAQGTSVITENVYERRFKYIGELNRMGADIKQEGRTAVVKGVDHLTAAPVVASDLRAGAALIVAGLAANGDTEITGVEHIDRGYENLVDKMVELGAQVARLEAEREGTLTGV